MLLVLEGARASARFGVWMGKTPRFPDRSSVLTLKRRKRRAPLPTTSGCTAPRPGRVQEWRGDGAPRFVRSTAFYAGTSRPDEPSPPPSPPLLARLKATSSRPSGNGSGPNARQNQCLNSFCLIPFAANSTNRPPENMARAGPRRGEGYGPCRRRSFYRGRGKTTRSSLFAVCRSNSCGPKP